MGTRKSPEQLAKFISYALGRRPDEFGLVPDEDGYVKLKEFLKAVCEEEGWRYVRKSHIDEIMLTLTDPPVETTDNLIRARDREHLPAREWPDNIPRLLYTCVRGKAHPVVLEHGISPAGRPEVVLASEVRMAERIGGRMDHQPVLLTVQVEKSRKAGVVFTQAGEGIYLANRIPAGCFTGPPLPKEKPEKKKQEPPEEKAVEKQPGSFLIDMASGPYNGQGYRRKQKKREKIAKEKDKKRGRKEKQKRWRSS